MKILLIDDAEDDYVLTNAYISDIDNIKYNLDWINNFTEGLKEIKNQNHDIYLIDYVLGEKNGIELIQKAITFGCNKPMIILTGAGSQNIDNQAMEIGAYDYLVKNEMSPYYLYRSIRLAMNAYKQREKINESEEKFRYLFEQSNDAISISDHKGKLLNINQAGLDLFEYNEEEIYLMKASELYYDSNDQLKFQKLLEKNGIVKDLKFKIKTKNGRIRDVITYSTPIFNQHKELIYYQSITRDITEKKIAEQEIEDSLNRYQTLFDTAPIGILVSRKNIILYANHNTAKLYGYDSDDEIVGFDMGVLFPEELRESQIRRDSRRLEGKQEPTSYDSTGLKKDGTCFLIHIEVNLIDLPDGPAILAFIQDITERKKLEIELKENEKKYRDLVETSHDLIWKCDAEGYFTYLNPAWEKTHGYKLEEMLGRPFSDFQTPEVFQRDMQEFGRHLAGGSVKGYETTQIAKSGKIINLVFNAIPLKNEKGEIIGTQGTAFDITDRMKAEVELKIIREQLYQAQKMEAIGRTTSSIAHDFNNLLTIMTLDAETLIDKISHEDPLLADVKRIIDTVETATVLTGELLSFCRPRIHKAKLININDLICKYLSTLGTLISKNIKQEINLEEQIGEVFIDPIHMEQVLMNIIINAIDAIPNGGLLKIETKNILPNTIQYQGLDSSQSHVEISISDTGIGMDEKTQDRIFEPFFTTKEEGKGTGLGLGIVYSIIQQNKGFINVKSELGKGTKISIYLPLRKSIVGIEKKIDILNQKANGQLLLIDDDDSIRKIIKRILDMNGFDVMDANDPFDAMRIFNENQDDIALVICDVLMPNLLGPELIEQISSIKPSIKVLYITADSTEFQSISQNLGRGTDILQKPFDADRLVKALKELLDND